MHSEPHHFETPAAGDVLAQAAAHFAAHFGRGSRSELERDFLEAISARGSITRGLASQIMAAVERLHVERYGTPALESELADERAFERATQSDAALVAYEQQWRRRLERLQRKHRARWAVVGLSEEEVVDALLLRLLELVREPPEQHPEYFRAGKPWGLMVLQAELRTLRRRFRVAATLMDFWEEPLPERRPSHEERWLADEEEICRRLARERVHSRLTPGQKRWLEALETAAVEGAFFRASAQPNLSAASRLLGKNRSSAQRAYAQLTSEFRRELERIG